MANTNKQLLCRFQIILVLVIATLSWKKNKTRFEFLQENRICILYGMQFCVAQSTAAPFSRFICLAF